MAKHVKVLKAADGGTEIDVELLSHSIGKNLTPYPDSDGTVNWADDNRYVQTVQVSGTVNRVGMEYLVATAKIVGGATYPQIVVYNKSAADHYNTYSAVQMESLNCEMLDDDLWRVTCVFKW